jgi:hypothetical protein
MDHSIQHVPSKWLALREVDLILKGKVLSLDWIISEFSDEIEVKFSTNDQMQEWWRRDCVVQNRARELVNTFDSVLEYHWEQSYSLFQEHNTTHWNPTYTSTRKMQTLSPQLWITIGKYCFTVFQMKLTIEKMSYVENVCNLSSDKLFLANSCKNH